MGNTLIFHVMYKLHLTPVVEHEVLPDQTLEMIKGGVLYKGMLCSQFSCKGYDGTTCPVVECASFSITCDNLSPVGPCEVNCMIDESVNS